MDWDTYGVDWKGPVPLDDDVSTVTVELSDMLTDSQKDQLKALLAPLSASDFSQQAMLGQFAIVKSFFQQPVFQKNNLSNLIDVHA